MPSSPSIMRSHPGKKGCRRLTHELADRLRAQPKSRREITVIAGLEVGGPTSRSGFAVNIPAAAAWHQERHGRALGDTMQPHWPLSGTACPGADRKSVV